METCKQDKPGNLIFFHQDPCQTLSIFKFKFAAINDLLEKYNSCHKVHLETGLEIREAGRIQLWQLEL